MDEDTVTYLKCSENTRRLEKDFQAKIEQIEKDFCGKIMELEKRCFERLDKVEDNEKETSELLSVMIERVTNVCNKLDDRIGMDRAILVGVITSTIVALVSFVIK